MKHSSIYINNLSLILPAKTCFANFSSQINYRDKIAIIGQNGVGKTSLLKILQNKYERLSDAIDISKDVIFGYVTQTIEDFENLSGGERFGKALREALCQNPNVLLLDEPTNHLDMNNRINFFRMLNKYDGTLIIVSHDEEVLRNYVDIFWHIQNGKIAVFKGSYDDYIKQVNLKRSALFKQISELKLQKKEMHKKLMQEQQRAKKSKQRGAKFVEQKRWLPAVAKMKQSSAEKASGKNKEIINQKSELLKEQLANLREPEIIKPKFSIDVKDVSNKVLVSICDGTIGYKENKILLKNITLSVSGNERIAINGDNGIGKSTLLKAILNDINIEKTGTWYILKKEEIGYLDQYYKNLQFDKTVLENIADIVPDQTHTQLRKHLNAFLFHNTEEVNTKASDLSGGEKVRLSLAKIAIKTPKLLLLDEITNNLDLETKEHVIQVLRYYPGAIILISHDKDFLDAIEVSNFYNLNKNAA